MRLDTGKEPGLMISHRNEVLAHLFTHEKLRRRPIPAERECVHETAASLPSSLRTNGAHLP